MFKTVYFVFVGLVLLVATVTHIVKYGSEIEHNNIARLEREIQTKREAIDILKANWSLLTNPARIQELAERHDDELQLRVLQSHQIISIDQIPLRPSPDRSIQNAKAAEEESGISNFVTGNIKPEGAER